MDNKRSLDDLFKQQRQSYDRTPSSELWTRLEKKLEQRPPRRAIVSVWWQVLTVAAVLLLLLLPIAYFTVTNQPNKNIAQNTAVDQEKIAEAETTDPVADTLAMVQQTTISKQQTDKAKNRQGNTATTVAEPAAKESIDSRPPVASAPTSVRGDQRSKTTQPPAAEQKSRTDATAPIRESAAPDDNALSTTRYAETADNSERKKAAIKPTATIPKPTLPALHLESGKAKNYLDALCQYGSGVVDIPVTAKGTITDQDVADLLPLLHSTRPCAAVQLSGQTTAPAQIQSTEGNEAYWLIKAYKDKKAYPIQKLSVKWDGNSVELYNTTSEIEKLEQWWRNRQ